MAPKTEQSLTETQRSICDWIDGITGTDYTLPRSLSRANEELAELNSAIERNVSADDLCEEAADVAICLCRPADILEKSIDAIIRAEPLPQSIFAVDRANLAMARLLCLCREHNQLAFRIDYARTQLGLVIVNLADFCASFGRDLGAEIDRKMVKNRARVWRVDGSGQAYHVKAPLALAPGQWVCGECRTVNDGDRKNCQNCHTLKPPSPAWPCRDCGFQPCACSFC